VSVGRSLRCLSHDFLFQPLSFLSAAASAVLTQTKPFSKFKEYNPRKRLNGTLVKRLLQLLRENIKVKKLLTGVSLHKSMEILVLLEQNLREIFLHRCSANKSELCSSQATSKRFLASYILLSVLFLI